MGIINDKIKQLIQGHEELITRENEPVRVATVYYSPAINILY